MHHMTLFVVILFLGLIQITGHLAAEENMQDTAQGVEMAGTVAGPAPSRRHRLLTLRP